MSPWENLVVTTPRLVLRPCRVGDFDSLADLFSMPETFRFPPRSPLGREDSWARLLRHIGNWSVFGYGLFVIAERAGGGFVGETGLARFRRDTDPALGDLPEASWTITPEAQGSGYATEAAAAALDWTRHAIGIERPSCMIHPDNLASLRVAQKLGFTECERVVHKAQPAIIFERLTVRENEA